MRKICLVGRERIFKDAESSEIHNDDFSLFALDGIEFGPVRTIPDCANPLDSFDDLREEFTTLNPAFHAKSFAIRLENGKELPC